MAVFDLYSKRRKRAKGEVIDVYRYDAVPTPLRVQLIHIFDDAIGDIEEYHDAYKGAHGAYKLIVDILRREYGVFHLSGTNNTLENHYSEFRNFILNEKNVDHVLDAIELGARAIDVITRDHGYRNNTNYNERADDALEEINARMKEHGFGYAVHNREVVRIDSQFLHSEVVKPALQLLNVTGYEGTQEEYLAAHEHYRHGRTKEALNDALKAFESIMKVICQKRGWSIGRGTASELIKSCFENNLVPEFWQGHFTSLRAMLESGVPTVRNKLGGHGQGAVPTAVPAEIVAYALHMTGAAIVLLAERDKASQ